MKSAPIDHHPQRPWTVHLIHHAHTDIGYTDTQNRIARFHAGFLDQAIQIAKKLRDGDDSLRGFRWTNECFWSIEQWLDRGGQDRLEELLRCLREGTIELTGTYLHYTELIDGAHLIAAIGRAAGFARCHQLPLDTAVAADINGFSWGYSQVLHDAGIRNLVTCVHSHHGLAPLGRRQVPFYWETPGGQKIFVWNGEHYNLGNALGLVPGAMQNYLFRDEITPSPRHADNYPVAAKRLPRYLRQLEMDGYPYGFVPVHVSGAMTDNAPPSEAIMGFIHQWNERHGDCIRLQMGSLSEYCRQVREHAAPIPQHRGDWPDWWSDGVASTPDETRMVRAAMRQARWLKTFSRRKSLPLPEPELRRLEQNILLYTEHTFNHSDSMATPWDLTTKAIGSNKKATASAAYDAASEVRDALFSSLGELPAAAPDLENEGFLYRVVNPSDEPVTDLAKLYLESKDFDVLPHAPVVTDLQTGRVLVCSNSPAPRGRSFEFPLRLEAGGQADFSLQAGCSTLSSVHREFCDHVADDVAGSEAEPGDCRADRTGVETRWLKLDFAETGEIISLVEKSTGMELLDPNREHAPFTPVYEVTPAGGNDQRDVRRGFGRNRKGKDVRRFAGSPSGPRFPEDRKIRIPVEMEFPVEGADWFRVFLQIWRDLPRIDVAVRLQKKCVWDAENLYLALPFAVPGGQLWVDKPGGPLRPWQDQLPDTLTDWFCIQDGFVSCRQDFGLCVTTPDAPLLQLGPLAHGTRKVMGHPDLRQADARPYSWLMTNYWETNFEANLGGFHEFNFRIECGSHLSDPEKAIRHCALLNHGLQAFRVSEKSGGTA